jgi:hypothetical protein
MNRTERAAVAAGRCLPEEARFAALRFTHSRTIAGLKIVGTARQSAS